MLSRYTFGALFLLLGSLGPTPVLAQCSAVSILGPESVRAGEYLKLEAKLNVNEFSRPPEFKWQISAGTITSEPNGQSITIDTTGLGNQDINATVEVVGLRSTCATATVTVKISPPPECGTAFDEYGDLKFEDEEARLDNFAIQLSLRPDMRGHILGYAGQRTYANEAAERLKRAKDYLVNVRGLDPRRIVTLDLGHRSDFTIKLYVVPQDIEFDVKIWMSVVPANQLKFTKPRPKQANKIKQRR